MRCNWADRRRGNALLHGRVSGLDVERYIEEGIEIWICAYCTPTNDNFLVDYNAHEMVRQIQEIAGLTCNGFMN